MRLAFQRLVAVARESGPATVYAQKTRIVIQARVRFASVMVRATHLRTTLWLKRTVRHPRIVHVDDLGPLGFIYSFTFSTPTEIDSAFEALVHESYRAAIARSEENGMV